MPHRVEYSERIPMGGRSISQLLSLLELNEWKLKADTLQFVVPTACIKRGPSDRISAYMHHAYFGGYAGPPHLDELRFEGSKLVRYCPHEKSEILAVYSPRPI